MRSSVAKPDLPGKLSLLIGIVFLAGCASQDGAPKSASSTTPPDATPRTEPKSRYGNPPVYEVYGVRYQVMDSSHGYQERGVASWYGKKFHGRATSSQEPYDMYAMTAAHRTLPLPTYVEVKNLNNGRTVTVRVNDRGPFVDNRIIDLSYSAAKKLDMIRDGTALVEVTALSAVAYQQPTPKFHDEPARGVQSDQDDDFDVFVQVGAFGDVDNAQRRFESLKDLGIDNAVVHKDTSRESTLYRIRVGPIDGVDDYDALVAKLGQVGITESHLVTN